jgi:hypothetical protein
MTSIQTVFNDCDALDQQRHFAQRILVPFTLDLQNENQTDPQDLIEFTLNASGFLAYQSAHRLRVHPPGPSKTISLGTLVFIPGNLVGSVVANAGLSGHGTGGDFTFDIGISISGPLSAAGSISQIDIYATDAANKPWFVEFEADPNAPLPLDVQNFSPVHNKNKLHLLLQAPQLVLKIPRSPVVFP